MYVCQSPQKGALLHMGKNIRSPTQTEDIHTMGCALVPQGDRLMTLLSVPQCLAAFDTTPSTLAWVDRSPVSQHVL
jgi:ABC-type branched-subunit amino acid transport system ATPase component